MLIESIIAGAVIVLIVGGATAYIIKAKKSGKKCIGCPDSSACHSNSGKGGCGGVCANCGHCGEHSDSEEK